jgi:hypothetical protein
MGEAGGDENEKRQSGFGRRGEPGERKIKIIFDNIL